MQDSAAKFKVLKVGGKLQFIKLELVYDHLRVAKVHVTNYNLGLSILKIKGGG